MNDDKNTSIFNVIVKFVYHNKRSARMHLNKKYYSEIIVIAALKLGGKF
jgi:hypothetical protein